MAMMLPWLESRFVASARWLCEASHSLRAM
jgi:hypothetical protein